MTPQWLLATFVQSCIILDRVAAGVDEYGNPVYETVPVATSKALLQPVAQADIQAGRAAVGSFILFLPVDVAPLVNPFTSYAVEGETYESDGAPSRYSALFNRDVHHLEVNVVRSSA